MGLERVLPTLQNGCPYALSGTPRLSTRANTYRCFIIVAFSNTHPLLFCVVLVLDVLSIRACLAGLKCCCSVFCFTAFFRKRIQDRIDEYESKLAAHAPAQRAVAAPSSNAEDYRNGLPKVDYRAMIVEQAAHIAEMEKVHERYQELLDQCLQTVSQDLDKHASVGEYRDAGEYRYSLLVQGSLSVPVVRRGTNRKQAT